MPHFASLYDADIATVLSDIDNTQLSDFVGQYTTNTNGTRILSGQFQLDGGREMTFGLDRSLEVIDGRTIGVTGSQITTVFELVGNTGSSATIHVQAEVTFDLSGGFDLTGVFADGSDLVISSTNADTTGFDGDDFISGTGGSLRGGEGNDTIRFGTTFGPSSGFTLGFGEEGDDVFELYDNRGAAVGGSGDDTFLVASGSVGLFGGTGADTFIFDNASERVETTDNLFAVIRDFDTSEDSVVFADVAGNSFGLPFATQGQTSSFADLFATSDLSTLSRQTFDDQVFFFGHASDGDARIFRRGTDESGFEFTENVRFDGLSLADLDPGRIFIATFDSVGL